jgi:hypothetical protein
MRVLTECDDGWVVNDGEGLRRHVAKIVAKEQWRLEGCPEREVRFVLFVGHPALADFEHVEIRPPAWNATISERCDLVEDEEHGAMSAGRDAVGRTWLQGIACAKIVGTREGVVDVASDAP